MGKKQRIEEGKGQVLPFHQSAQFLYEKGMKAYRRHKLDEAIKYLRRAIHVEQDSFMMIQLASALSEAGHYHESNQLLQRILQLDETMPECYYYLANNCAFLGLFQQAKKYAKQYLEIEEDGEFAEETWELLDIIEIEEEGDSEFEDEDELIVMQERANRFMREGKTEEAIATLRAVLQDYPEFWSAYNNLAIAYFQLGQLETAMNLLDEVLEKNPGNLHALCNSLIVLYSIGRENEASRLADQLEHVYPILMEQRLKLGVTLATVGRFQSAYNWLKSLKRYGYEGDASFQYWLSYAAYMVGDVSLAEKMWEQVITAHPEREGKEPWGKITFTDGNQNAILGQLHMSYEEAEHIAEKMLALYLINELHVEAKKDVFLAIIQTEENQLLSKWARYFLLTQSSEQVPQEFATLHHCAQIADTLYKHTEKHDELIEECLQRWFYIFATTEHTSFANVTGWSAAVEYVVRSEQGENMSQVQIGKMYEVSVSTVRKYAQIVRERKADY